MTGCVAFDFDGTLVRSNRIKRECFYEVLADVPGAGAVLDELFAGGFQGDRHELFEEVVRRLSGRSGRLTPHPEELAAEYGRLTGRRIAEAPEVPGATDALEALRAAGVRLFLVSATPQAPLDDVVARRGLTGFFEQVLGRPADKEVHLRRLVAEVGIDPGDLVFVGDGRDDQAAAQAIGCRFVAVTDQPNAPIEGAAISIPDLRDLPAVLGLGEPVLTGERRKSQ